MAILLIFAFISGLVTIFAPCIWPILPIVLSASATGGHKKPLGITLGVIISFAVLTLSLSYILKIVSFDANILRLVAAIIIGVLGLTLVIPKLSGILEGAVSRLSGKLRINSNNNSGFWSGFVTGTALGIVWAPCAGPILATIAALAATQKVNTDVILVTVFYIIGVGIPLFLFATFGRLLFTRSRVLSKYTGRIQQVFGVIMIVTAGLIVTNYDKVIQVKLLDLIPSYSAFLNTLEGNPLVSRQLDKLKGQKSSSSNTSDLFNVNTPAPQLSGITNWLNLPPGKTSLTLADLKGQVVLVDFWTYTCINCIRTLPHVTSWYNKYHNDGFTVIGIHTPEFQFEKNTQNVQNAIKQFGINYPVAQDNDYATWNNFSNQYWPAEYLIDAQGNIRRTHFGEGEYDEMEKAIQILLKEKGASVSAQLDTMPDETPVLHISPETYLGANRMEYYYPSGQLLTGTQTFTLASPVLNSFSLGGTWNIMGEYSTTGKNATLEYKFEGNKVFLVMRPGTNKLATVKVYLDGKTISDGAAGVDVKNGIVSVNEDRLYELVNLKKNGEHTLKLEFQTPGIEAFAFTFG